MTHTVHKWFVSVLVIFWAVSSAAAFGFSSVSDDSMDSDTAQEAVVQTSETVEGGDTVADNTAPLLSDEASESEDTEVSLPEPSAASAEEQAASEGISGIPSEETATDSTTADDTASETGTAGSVTLLESLLVQSQALEALSAQLLIRSESLDPNGANTQYVTAMLRLASDIGVMANRIGEMANRIVYTEELIGVMADRIVTVSQALLGNNQATQTNILTAQRNFGEILSAPQM